MTFKIATWNVNSLKVRLPQVLEWLAEHQPDVLALQEIKLTDDCFPLDAIKNAGYESVFSGQKTYNGVAILSRKKGDHIVTGFPDFTDPQRRVLCATIDDVRVINLYVPNGESVESEKYVYKLNWLTQLNLFLQQELKQYSKVVVVGDFNIAPEPIDTYDPLFWQGRVLFSEPEKAAFQAILELGFTDCFRMLSPEAQEFSWWDYRMNAFKRKMGLRIDHVLASASFVSQCARCYIDKVPRAAERPSDHAPVVAEFAVDLLMSS